MARTEDVDEPGGQYQRVVDLLGGSKVFSQRVLTPLDAHNAIRKGLPGHALQSFVTNLRVLKPIDIEEVVGMSVRTYQRRSAAPEKPLSAEQGGRAWKLAEILAHATEIFGSQDEAERWLERPATGLDNRVPIDLLNTPPGVEMVETFLARLSYNVYT
jgi:putative toxin-antitoxin system antitoxin component (TIGR02293 family)